MVYIVTTGLLTRYVTPGISAMWSGLNRHVLCSMYFSVFALAVVITVSDSLRLVCVVLAALCSNSRLLRFPLVCHCIRLHLRRHIHGPKQTSVSMFSSKLIPSGSRYQLTVYSNSCLATLNNRRSLQESTLPHHHRTRSSRSTRPSGDVAFIPLTQISSETHSPGARSQRYRFSKPVSTNFALFAYEGGSGLGWAYYLPIFCAFHLQDLEIQVIKDGSVPPPSPVSLTSYLTRLHVDGSLTNLDPLHRLTFLQKKLFTMLSEPC